jgi:hypothetical protein
MKPSSYPMSTNWMLFAQVNNSRLVCSQPCDYSQVCDLFLRVHPLFALYSQ